MEKQRSKMKKEGMGSEMMMKMMMMKTNEGLE